MAFELDGSGHAFRTLPPSLGKGVLARGQPAVGPDCQGCLPAPVAAGVSRGQPVAVMCSLQA